MTDIIAGQNHGRDIDMICSANLKKEIRNFHVKLERNRAINDWQSLKIKESTMIPFSSFFKKIYLELLPKPKGSSYAKDHAKLFRSVQ